MIEMKSIRTVDASNMGLNLYLYDKLSLVIVQRVRRQFQWYNGHSWIELQWEVSDQVSEEIE